MELVLYTFTLAIGKPCDRPVLGPSREPEAEAGTPYV